MKFIKNITNLKASKIWHFHIQENELDNLLIHTRMMKSLVCLCSLSISLSKLFPGLPLWKNISSDQRVLSKHHIRLIRNIKEKTRTIITRKSAKPSSNYKSCNYPLLFLQFFHSCTCKHKELCSKIPRAITTNFIERNSSSKTSTHITEHLKKKIP